MDYDDFRRTTWEERIAIFNTLSAEGKAALFRSQVAGWLERHRAELTPPQIEFLEEAIELAVPELYTSPPPEELQARMVEFDRRARALLTPEQRIDALTMQWGIT